MRVVVFLASNEQEVQTRGEIADSTLIPLAYLTKVLRSLEDSELVEAKRGPGGGFQLSRSPNRISAYDVIEAVAELPRIHQCPLGISSHVRLCPLHARLDAVAKLAEEAFRETKISELIPRRVRAPGCSFPLEE